MTIRKRLAHSNIAMLVIPLLTAAVLALLDAAVVLVLLRGDIAALHDALEQVESLLHGFKALPAVYLTAMTLLVLLTVAATNVYLTRRLFRHISEPLEVLTAGVARIRDGDFETPIAYGGCDEFRPACDAVDEMAARLRGSTSAAIRPSLSRSRCPLQRRTDMDKILIIEDDPDIAAIERDYLELSGCAVTICANGTDGQRAALEGAFDLILLDLMLPGTDGFSICRAVRAQKDIPLLMVTALGKDADKIRGLGFGADDYIEKTFSPSVLVAHAKANPAHPQLLQTVWGVGYRLRKDNEPS